MPNKIEAVIFDVDGVLLDSMSYLNTSALMFLEKFGIKPDADLKEVLFAETFQSGIEYIIKTYKINIHPEKLLADFIEFQEYTYINEMKPKKYAKETLEYLSQAGIPMVIATSNERHFCVEAMKRLNFLDYFAGIITSPEIGNSKHEPDIFKVALQMLNKPKENTLLFEDGLHAITTANKMDLPVVGVYDEESSDHQAEIKRLSNQYVKDLGEWLDSPVGRNLEI